MEGVPNTIAHAITGITNHLKFVIADFGDSVTASLINRAPNEIRRKYLEIEQKSGRLRPRIDTNCPSLSVNKLSRDDMLSSALNVDYTYSHVSN